MDILPSMIVSAATPFMAAVPVLTTATIQLRDQPERAPFILAQAGRALIIVYTVVYALACLANHQ